MHESRLWQKQLLASRKKEVDLIDSLLAKLGS
jgi:hypothetical protein